MFLDLHFMKVNWIGNYLCQQLINLMEILILQKSQVKGLVYLLNKKDFNSSLDISRRLLYHELLFIEVSVRMSN